MSDDIEKDKTKAKLENFGQLVEKYAQSRSLGLLLLVVLIIIGTILTVVLMKVAYRKPVWWLVGVVMVLMAGAGIGGLWLAVKVLPKYESKFYSKEGQIELKQKKVPILACVLYVVTFLGPVALNAAEIMPTRWALPLALVSLGVFAFYASGKEKQRPLGAVFCAVLLVEAVVTAAGVPTPFSGKGWLYSCFVALMMYIAGASLITAIVVHIYNRLILRKIKRAGLFGEQEKNRAGLQRH